MQGGRETSENRSLVEVSGVMLVEEFVVSLDAYGQVARCPAPEQVLLRTLVQEKVRSKGL